MMSIRKPRLLRISLRALLVLVTLLCVGFAKLSIAARRQQATVAWIVGCGGRVTYDWQEGKTKEFPAPGWVRSLLGDDCFQTPTRVTLTHFRGLNLAPLSQLRGLRSLDLTSDGITDTGPLAQFHELRELTLTDNELTSLDPLRSLTQLRSLNLDYNLVHDIAALASLKELQSLSLEHNRIRDVRPLGELPRLRALNVSANPLRDHAVLGELRQLTSLRVGRNGFSGTRLDELRSMLAKTAIEEASVPPSLDEP